MARIWIEIAAPVLLPAIHQPDMGSAYIHRCCYNIQAIALQDMVVRLARRQFGHHRGFLHRSMHSFQHFHHPLP